MSVTSSRHSAAIETTLASDEHGLAAQGVGQAAAGQLEEQHHDALHRGADADLGEREPAVAHAAARTP